MEKALDYLYSMKKANEDMGTEPIIIYEAIKELEDLQKEKVLLEEYVQFARLHIETYRCKCGSLGRVGYLCSNKECSEV